METDTRVRVVNDDASGDAGNASDPEPTYERPVPSGSPMASLRERAQKARTQRFIDLPVPYMDGIVVRYGPIPADRLEKIRTARKKANEHQMLLTSADILVATCLAVFDTVDDELVGVDPANRDVLDDDGNVTGSATKFGPELAELLGAETSRAVDVVKALYPTDGDIVGAADKVVRFSGYMGEDIEDVVSGN